MSFTTKSPNEQVRESRFGLTDDGELVVEHAAITFTNFSGKPTKFNQEGGRRTFELVLSERVAIALIGDGWNVKTIKGKHDDDPTLYVTEIVVRPAGRLSIFLCEEIGGKKYRWKIKNDEIGDLDDYQYSDVALLIQPYVHGRENSAGSKIKGYLRQANFVKVNEYFFKGQFADYCIDERPVMREPVMVPDEDDDWGSDSNNNGWMDAAEAGDIPFM